MLATGGCPERDVGSLRITAGTVRRSLAVALALVGSACSLTPSSPIPGASSDPITLKPIPVSTVLIALKCQVETGLTRIQDLKDRLRRLGDPSYEIFDLRKGDATFTGKTTVIGTDDGEVSIVIPTGISTITPNVGGKLTATATEEISRKFSLGTEVDVSICNRPELSEGEIVVGSFVSDRMVAAFQDSLAVPIRRVPDIDEKTGLQKIDQMTGLPKKKPLPFGPALQNTEISITATFSVQRTLEAGIDANVLFSSTNSSSPTLTPGIAFVNDEKGDYTINVTFPMTTSDPGDGQRFYRCVRKANETYCLESPYDEKEHEVLVNDRGDSRRFYQCFQTDGTIRCLESPYIKERYSRLLPGIVEEEGAPQGLLRTPPSVTEFDLEATDPPPLGYEVERGPSAF